MEEPPGDAEWTAYSLLIVLLASLSSCSPSPLAPPQVFSTPLFKEMVKNCISQDLSWAKPARRWEGLYRAGAARATTTPCTCRPNVHLSLLNPTVKFTLM